MKKKTKNMPYLHEIDNPMVAQLIKLNENNECMNEQKTKKNL